MAQRTTQRKAVKKHGGGRPRRFKNPEQMKQELAEFVGKIHAKGAKILVSNSDPTNHDSQDRFFDSLYASYTIRRVEASRMINSDSKARGKIRELLISNS